MNAPGALRRRDIHVRRRRLLSSCTACTVLVAGSSAAAQTGPDPRPPAIELHAGACPELPRDDLARLVHTQVRADVVDAAARPGETPRVDVACDAQAATIAVRDPLTRKSLSRAIAVDAYTGGARTRLVALAIAELVEASWAELETNPTPAAPPAGPPPPAEAVEAARDVLHQDRHEPPSMRWPRRPPLHRVAPFFGVRWFPASTDPRFGAGVRYGRDDEGLISWEVDAMIESTDVDHALGRVSVLASSLGGAVEGSRRFHGAYLRSGVGLRGGVARLEGQPARGAIGGAVFGPWIAPTLASHGTVPFTRRLALDVGTEIGYVVLPVRGLADGARVAGVEGFFMALQLGAAVLF